VNVLHKLCISEFETELGFKTDLTLSYQIFGQSSKDAPIVLVNHALTGNSNVTGEQGWWNEVVGPGKVIDTNKFCVLAFNIPGNGYAAAPEDLIHAYEQFTLRDIAKVFLQGLSELNIDTLYAIIGGSIGGSLAWEMVALRPDITQHLIPIAADWKASDWLLANVRVQKQILEHSQRPLEDARMHAMIFYRTAASFKEKFSRSEQEGSDLFRIESWLYHHGDKLRERFDLSAYKLLNHLLGTADISRGKNGLNSVVKTIEASIHLVGIDSDGFYVNSENYDTLEKLSALGKKIKLSVINSIHGHDAFLIEYAQLLKILEPIFVGGESSIQSKKMSGETLSRCA